MAFGTFSVAVCLLGFGISGFIRLADTAGASLLVFQFNPLQNVLHGVIGAMAIAAALRSFLRQDPNIVLVGEIRDFETAEIAVKAALTGHLVLSTLHTNDSAGAITRLVDIGIEPFLISSAVIAVAAQRLVRVLCEKCKEPYHPDEMTLRNIGLFSMVAGLLLLYLVR